MDKISKLTRNTLVDKNLGRAAEAAFICHLSNKAIQDFFDKDFLKEIKIISFRDGYLFFSTSNSTYAQEIKMKEKEIVSKTNELLGKKLVEKIRFKSARN